MVSKTKESGRENLPLRVSPELKSRVIEAATEDGVTNNDWVVSVIEEALAKRDAEVAAGKRKADLERRRDMKFEEIISYLTAEAKLGDRTALSADKLIELHEKAESAIEDWRNHAASNCRAEPRTPLERRCKDHCDLDAEIEGGVHPDNSSDIDPLDLFADLDFDDADEE